MKEQWEFLRDGKRRWYWRYTTPEGSHRVSSQAFATFDQCAADAAAHGYEGDAVPKPNPNTDTATQ